MKKPILTMLLGGSLLLTMNMAQAATVSFEFLSSGGSPVVSGSFSFDDSKTGVVSYQDLDTFQLQTPTSLYTLSDILSFTDYLWLSYDVIARQFNTGYNLSGFGGAGYSALMSATNSGGTSGFFLHPNNEFANYSVNGHQTYRYDNFRFEVSNHTVPEPSTLLLGSLALLGIGALRRSGGGGKA